MSDVRLIDRLETIPATAWDGLHDGANPFVAHAFLSGLETHGCLRPEWGWTPRHLTLWRDGALVAAAPGYLKHNSHGEFVFDHAWAHAYAQHGLEYFPKQLCAVPYSPVTGPRLLAATGGERQALLAAMVATASDAGLSSAHVNFHTAAEDSDFNEDWLPRVDVQYQWHNDAGWRDFADYLDAFDHRHRKNIRQERAKVARAGIGYRVVDGSDATPADLATMHRFYRQTFAEYGNHPALTLAFLHHLAETMPRSLVLVIAERANGAAVAGALCLRGRDTLYGRYWGATETIPGLHFETCYYQGIEYCLRKGLSRFEPGAQGEHKLARGFLPRTVRSRHWIAHPAFREALRAWCTDEAEAVRRYSQTLASRSPFKSTPSTRARSDADPPA